MPTWKRKDTDGTLHFQFLCRSCSEKKQAFLEKNAWILVRDGEPASCNDCVLKCLLTAQELWGAEDSVRYAVCAECPELAACPLQGRYYC